MKRPFTNTAWTFPITLIFAAAGCLCLSSVGYSQSQTFGKVAAWNQQGVRFPGPNQVVPINKPEQLRTVIAALLPDVIALSEVNSRASMDQIVATPLPNGESYKFDMDDDQPRQKIAVLFKDSPDVSVGNRRVVPGSNANNPDLRKAWAFDVKIRNFDFILIAVHLKSGRGKKERLIRNTQTRAIARFIRQETAATSEKDVLVVGDYNMVPGQDAQNFANLSPGPAKTEYLRFISSMLKGPSHIGQCTSPSAFHGNLLDGFSISRAHTSEWTGYIRLPQLQALLPNMWCDKYKNTISDHLPVVARFRVSDPDDD